MGAALPPAKREQLIKEKEDKITKNIDAETAETIKNEKKRIREEYMAILRQNSQVSQKNPYARQSQTNIYAVDFQNKMRTLLSPPGTKSPGNPLGLPGLDDNGNLRPGAVWGGVPGATPGSNNWADYQIRIDNGKYKKGTEVNSAIPADVKKETGLFGSVFQELKYRQQFNPDGTAKTPSGADTKKEIAADTGLKKKQVEKAAKQEAKSTKVSLRNLGASKKEAKKAAKEVKQDILTGKTAPAAATPQVAVLTDPNKKQSGRMPSPPPGKNLINASTPAPAASIAPAATFRGIPLTTKKQPVPTAAAAPAPTSLLGSAPTNKAEEEVALAIDPKKKKASNTAVRAAGSGSKSLLSTRTQMK